MPKLLYLQIMLLAAKLQKQKDAEEATAAQAVALPLATSSPGSKFLAESADGHTDCHSGDTRLVDSYASDTTHVDIGDRFLTGDVSSQEAAEIERHRLRRISDRIDECVQRVARVEQHWNTNVQTIFKLLGHDYETERTSYV